MLHPITFSFPEEKIIDKMPMKTKLLSSLIPGDPSTYIYNTEAEYYNEYRESMFAITKKKAGWDCMRHYEIIANGCIPYFLNIEDCPINTMALLPKNLIKEGNTLYLSLKDKSIPELSSDEMDACTSLIRKLLDNLRSNLTTTAMATHVLKQSNHMNARRILYLSGDTRPDYLRCVTLHGFKTLRDTTCHDYPKVPHIYRTTTIDYSRLYGKGITYTNLLDSILHNNEADKTVKEDILNRLYDVIIYGSYHRGMPFYDIIQQVYKPEDVVLICGEDIHRCNNNEFIKKGHCIFVRELQGNTICVQALDHKTCNKNIDSMIQSNYERECKTASDINQHLPTLRAYAAQCSSVAEMGVRSVVSTWAFLQGLVDSSSSEKSLQCLDIADAPSIHNICKDVKALANIDMSFVKGDSAKTAIKPVDLLFIDTWHVYGHLKRELEFHHANVAKYIIMHDTTVDAFQGESIRMGWNTAQQAATSGYPEAEIRKGLKPAIDEFLVAHPEWVVKEVFTNNNGLTVLQRV